MSKGQELLLGANDPQESPLGLNVAETSPNTDGNTLCVITEIVTSYDHDVGRKAQHAIAEISALLRKRVNATEAADSEGRDK